MEKEKSKREIPFGKAVRVMNYKMWKVNVSVGNKQTIPAICVSNLDGTWKVQIPSTSLMYSALTDLYSTEEKKDFDILFSFLTNFNFATTISTGHYQNMLILLTYAYMNPQVLDEGFDPADGKNLSHKEFMDRIKSCVVEYQAFAKEQRKEEDLTEEEYKQAETAAEMQESLEQMEKEN